MTATRDQLCQLSGVLNRGSEQSNLFSPLVLGTGHIAIGSKRSTAAQNRRTISDVPKNAGSQMKFERFHFSTGKLQI
jgi:hypothetical protein